MRYVGRRATRSNITDWLEWTTKMVVTQRMVVVVVNREEVTPSKVAVATIKVTNRGMTKVVQAVKSSSTAHMGRNAPACITMVGAPSSTPRQNGKSSSRNSMLGPWLKLDLVVSLREGVVTIEVEGMAEVETEVEETVVDVVAEEAVARVIEKVLNHRKLIA